MSESPRPNLEPGRPVGRTPRKRMSPGMVFVLFLLILAVYVAHQDFWNWSNSENLVLGFLPVGLAYHAGYSVVCSILMAILVQTAWPSHLEETESSTK